MKKFIVIALALLIAFGAYHLYKGTSTEKIYSVPEAVTILNDVYKDTSGFLIGTDERLMIENKGGNATYGEILPQSVAVMLADHPLTKKDVFYDLGSGTGKVCVQVALTTPARAVGVELSSSRHKIAQAARQELLDKKIMSDPRKLTFIEDDILAVDLSDATIIFLCSTCFSEELMQKLVEKIAAIKHPARVFTLKKLPPQDLFKEGKTYHLPMTWSDNTAVHSYELL